MSTKSSSTVQITLSGVGAVDFTKSMVDKNVIQRSSADGLHVLQHSHSTTSRKRRRNVVRLSIIDAASDPQVQATATLTVDSPEGEADWAAVAAKGIVDFLAANTHEEADLLVAGHNYG